MKCLGRGGPVDSIAPVVTSEESSETAITGARSSRNHIFPCLSSAVMNSQLVWPKNVVRVPVKFEYQINSYSYKNVQTCREFL